MRGNVRRRLGVRVSVMVVASMVGSMALLGGPVSAAVGNFSDDDGSVHEGAIEAIAAAGITRGCNPPANDLFCPDDQVTRGQMAAFLVRALDLSATDGTEFIDDNGSTFEGEIEKLAAAGVTRGCNPPGNDRFCPNDPVTRGQMAAFLRRALEDRLTAGPVTDFIDDNGSTFEADIEWLGATGVTKGCNPPDNDRFCPDEPVTRGQMASFLMRGLGLEAVPLYPIGEPGPEDVALVSRFHVYRDADNPFHVFQMAYWPRSFSTGFDIDPAEGTEGWQLERVDDPGAYRGWDILSPPTHWGFDDDPRDDDWLNFTLTRPATVAVVWRDDASLPGWLKSGWREGTGVTVAGRNARVYLKDFPAGRVQLGTVEGSSGNYKTMYFLLLAEAGGTPSPTPPIPSATTYPVPGQPCPTWVHDTYTTTGPDGETYATWHPQWDPVYWCSFGHDHGSDPSLIPGAPMVPYEYVSVKNGREEPHPGFKEFIFKDLAGEHWVRMVVHMGTSGQSRVCQQFHSVTTMVYDLEGNELMNVGFMADFGRAVNADTGAALSPTNCVESLPSADNDRTRMINMSSDEHHYEQWNSFTDTQATANLGFGNFQLGVDNRNPVTECTSASCNAVQKIDRFADGKFDNGSERAIEVGRWDGGLDVSPTGAFSTGEFFTNARATQEVSASAAGAVRQYLSNDAALVDLAPDSGDFTTMCNTLDPWTMSYTCRSVGNGDKFPNVPDMQLMCALGTN
ncbi:MAG: S-layer homology domain-containing protein [Acidimicrobiia bacterium]